MTRNVAIALGVLAASLLATAPVPAEDPVAVPITLLVQRGETLPKLSNLDLPPADEGVLGARLAIDDNNTTGRFLGQTFELSETIVPEDGDLVPAFRAALEAGTRLFVVDAPAETLLGLADLPGASEALIFNATAPDDSLRLDDCRANVMHVAPSRAMLADALAQFLVAKRWRDWFLVVGHRAGDRLFAEAMRRAAARFGGRIVAEKSWDYGADARRTAQAEVPAFTQGVDYDILVVADEIGEFGEYLMYRTWDPRPVAGTQGLAPTSWHWTHEQWGAAQLQSRFEKAFGRKMRPDDYTVWAAVRAVGEAATRAGSGDPEEILGHLRSDAFELAAFKGQKLTFRPWNRQLRQPILLAQPTSLVSVSPQEGFLHPTSYLDTLGYDRQETPCPLAQ